MGKIVTITSGWNNILMPDGNQYNAGQTVTLTDSEYTNLTRLQTRACTLTTSGVAEPSRPQITGGPLAQRMAAAESKIADSYAVDISAAGAVGDGTTDDTAAIQAVINATPIGGTINADRSKTYVINQTLTFPSDYITFDGRGAAFRFGTTRSGVNTAKTEDRMFQVQGRTGLTLKNFRILSSLGTVADNPSIGGKIAVITSTRCVVENVSVEGEQKTGQAILFYQNTECIVRNCYINQGGVGGFGNAYCRYINNRSAGGQNSNVNAFTGTSATGSDSKYNLYENNVVSGHARVGFEEYAINAGTSYGHTFRGNTILAPGSGASQMGISAPGATRVTFVNNYIIDAVFTGIESSAYGSIIEGNKIEFSSTGHTACDGIQVNSSDATTGGYFGSTVVGNYIRRATKGINLISAVSGTPLGGVTISGNVITDPIDTGINLSTTYQSGGAMVVGNQIKFTEQQVQATRIGINTGSNCVFMNNQVSYTTGSAHASNNDLPFFLNGSKNTMIGNIVDDGGRVDAHLIASDTVAAEDTYSNWIFVANRWGFSGVNKLGANRIMDRDTAAFSTYTANTGSAFTVKDVGKGDLQVLTLTANCTLTFPTASAGKELRIALRQDGTGSRTVTWPGTVKWPAGTAPTLTTTINKYDFFRFICHDGTNWLGTTEGQNYS